MPIDLRQCKPGDILISKHGMELVYIKELASDDYYDHLVEYPDGTHGSRIHTGHVYRNPERRLDCDNDIVKIIHK